MKKDLTMKKSTFVKGAFITTLGIIISKILGIIYVIPFHAIIGETGGALYGYAYTIYLVFMSLSTAGIPLAISRIVSEYQTLGYYRAKKRVFVLGKRIALLLGIICFLIIMVFAPMLAKAVLGNVTGGNSIEDVTFVIRVIGTAILIVPVLSIYRGYFEGHRFMSAPSISQVLEQIVRVLIIIFGSLMALKVFRFDLTTAVGIALFGATVGALVAYLYLVYKKLRNKRKFNERIRQVNEPIITDKVIISKIIYYAIPFIMIDLFKTAYNYVDMVTVVKGLVNTVNFSAVDAETIYSMLSTWANKFNMIVLAISTGVVVSLIPNITESVVKKQEKEVNAKTNQALSILVFLTIPMTLGISFLAKPIWTLFYGNSTYGPSVLSYYIFLGFIIGLFTCVITILQVLKDYKAVFISLIIGVIIKVLLNHNLLIAFNNMKLPPYYGFITASILGYFISFIICITALHNKYQIRFEYLVRNLIDIICGSLVMIVVLSLIKLIIPIYSMTRLTNLIIVIAYALIGAIVYFVYAYFTGLTKKIFGKDIVLVLKRVLTKK
ncbi:MAG: polysaccharide biosynthesis protein [Bacilli bacterium]|nr:polysaccharide biosynthesis protein [Bacilli bacterium]